MTLVVSKLKVTQLKAELSARNLPTSGLKAVLSERLQQALDQETAIKNSLKLIQNSDSIIEKRPRSPSSNGNQEWPNKLIHCSPEKSMINHQKIDPSNNIIKETQPLLNDSSSSIINSEKKINTLPQDHQLIPDSEIHTTTSTQSHSVDPIHNPLDQPKPIELSDVAVKITTTETSKPNIESQSSPQAVHPQNLETPTHQSGASIHSPQSQSEPKPIQTQPLNSVPSNVGDGSITTEMNGSPVKLEPEGQSRLQDPKLSKMTPSELTSDVNPVELVILAENIKVQPSKSEQTTDALSPLKKDDTASSQVDIEMEAYQPPKAENSTANHLKTDDLHSSDDQLKIEPISQPPSQINPSKEPIESETFAQSHQLESITSSNLPLDKSIESSEIKNESQTAQLLDAQNKIDTTSSPAQISHVDPAPIDHALSEKISNAVHTTNDTSDSGILPSTTTEPQPTRQTSISPSLNNTLDHSSLPPETVTQSPDGSALKSDDQPINGSASPSKNKDVSSNQPASTPIVSIEPVLEPATTQLPSASKVGTSEAVIDTQTASVQEKIERLLDSDEPPPTRSLYIRNLVRPLTVNQLKKKLSEFGELDYFWIDSIRSHTYVTFQKDSAAQAAYCSMHQTTPWPPETGKILELMFIPEKEVSRLVAEEEETSRSYGGRLGLHVIGEKGEWKFELRQISNGTLHQPRGLASSIPSSQSLLQNNSIITRSLTFDNLLPPPISSSKELSRSLTDAHLNQTALNKNIIHHHDEVDEKPVLEFESPLNYPKGGPENWFKKTKTKPHLFYSPCLP